MSVEVFAIADEPNAIDEFDEDNNVRSAILSSEPQMLPHFPAPRVPEDLGQGEQGAYR